MKIAILDNINEDIGLKILFPEADYYICETKPNREPSYIYYNFTPKMNIENITDKLYDILFIIMPIRHLGNNEPAVENIRNNYNTKIKKIIDENNFKKVCFFDNEDYEYDPNIFIPNPNILFFKRNCSKNKIYPKNVIPFPFIMFGTKSLIERMDRDLYSQEEYFKQKLKRVFFTGGLYVHDCKPFNVYVNRIDIYNQIAHTIYNPGPMDNNTFMTTLRESKYGLDIHGAGNPNIRTFEILISGALLLQQKTDVIWPFEEQLSEECLFIDAHDYLQKLKTFEENAELYNKCLQNQYNIVKKYFNKKWIQNYIHQFINENNTF